VFGSLDPEKLLIVFVVAIIVLGPDKLPKLARQMAVLIRQWQDIRDKSMGELRSGFKELTDLDPPRYTKGTIRSLLFDDTLLGDRQPLGNESISGGFKPTTDTKQDIESVEETGSVEGEGMPNLDSRTISLATDVQKDKVDEDGLQNTGSGFYEPSLN